MRHKAISDRRGGKANNPLPPRPKKDERANNPIPPPPKPSEKK